MQKFTIDEINEKYDLELDDIINKIKKQKARLVLLQFADGLKQYATSVVDYLEEKTGAEFLIWLGSCYGACDIPEVKKLGVDLLVQWGHSEFIKAW